MLVPRKVVLQWSLLLIFYMQLSFAFKKDLKIVFLVESAQKGISEDIAASIKEIEEMHSETEIKDSLLIMENFQDEIMETFCQIIYTEGASLVIDFTYQQWNDALNFINAHQIPYLHVDRMLNPFLKMFGEYLQQKDANDVALIFQNEQDTNAALYQMIDGFAFRTMIVNADDNASDFVQRLKQLRPSPSYFAIFASGSNMNTIFERVFNGNLFERPTEWHFVFLDARDRVFKFKKQVEFATKFTLNAKQLCRSMQMKDTYCSSGFTFQRAVLLGILRSLIDGMQTNTNWLVPSQYVCINDTSTLISYQSNTEVFDRIRFNDFLYLSTDEELETFLPSVTFAINVSINLFSNEHEAITDLALWQGGELRKINQTISPAKRFFRIGTAENELTWFQLIRPDDRKESLIALAIEYTDPGSNQAAIPWSYYRRDMRTGEILLDGNGKPTWEGYCIDFIATLSEKLKFDYEIISPTKGRFGDRDPITGQWDGVVGDLVSGETDFAVAALKMYSEREEVIDFIAPYFEQTGISIVIRKPVRQTSLFKFMTVLRLEVWLSIIAALVTTAFMIWLLDKYSPYSSRNNKQAYPYPCREFTLRESFWFALTSFTPQGGGEAPKAVSGRILVAAYWLFVVLMLATFTANLAAFLTVERMQTPVQSLEQLARQSRINYTVVANSDTHQYFINMKFAEDTLYRMWKELALNATTDFARYRIWDYPIKEQYGQILLAINGSNPVLDAAEGFRKVNEHENADFAFIHDSSEIKYEVTHNCNFTEVGEVFAEQPYAIAVQQGSHLADEFTYAILELQKDRYFEELKAKYWNRSRLKECALSDNQEGITLESLGGVFIATLFGLGLAMLTLAGEVFYYKRKQTSSTGFGNITKVIPIKDVVPKPREDAWFSGKKSKTKMTPPPSFESVTFRGKKVPKNITLGGTEFKPRRTGISHDTLRSSGVNSNNMSAAKLELPPYVE